MQEAHEIGAELRRALEARGCALSAAEARTLSVTLIDLIAAGLLVGGPVEAAPAYNMGQSNYRGDSE